MTRTRRASRSPVLAILTALLICLALIVASCEEPTDPTPAPDPSPTAKPTRLTLGVWGEDAEIRAFQEMVDLYNDEATSVEVSIDSWPSQAAMQLTIDAGVARPDLFMTSRDELGELGELVGEAANVPLLELLDERGVDFGDGYSREALLAFSADSELQCMPYGVSPMVMYYNTELIDFAAMEARELPVPALAEDQPRGWNLEMFEAAADFASRPKRGTSGLHIDPTLDGLSSFIYSGGGNLYDDALEPTSLALSEEGSREALAEALPVLRNPQLTLTQEQLDRATPVQWFKRGRLGTLAGFRDLTPELRQVPSLMFDVMPMPVLDSQATVGDITGLCISASAAPKVAQAADFLVHAISEEGFAPVAEAGYVVPANLPVAASDAFLQPTQMPASARVFNDSVRQMELTPLVEDFDDLESAVQESIRLLLTIPVIDDLEVLTALIDEQSRAVLDPGFLEDSLDPDTDTSEPETP